MTLYRWTVVVFALTFIALGLTMIVVTVLRGGGIGLLLGALFVGLGAGRLYMFARR